MIFASPTRRLALLAALASSMLIAACGGGGGSDAGTTTVRALNLTTDLPSVDLYTGDTKQFSALATDALAASLSFEANTYTLNVKKAGDGATLLTGPYALSKDKHFTAVVWGRETALRLSTLPEDENTADIAAGNTRVRFFNATTDTGSLDIFITSANADLGETSPTQGALTSGSLSGFRDLSKGSYRLRVTGAGDPNDVRLDIASITLDEKKYATLVLTAGAGGVLVNGSLIEQQGVVTTLKNTKARVRMAASVGGAGNIGASLGINTLVGALRSPGVGPYTLVASGSQQLVVRVNGVVISTTTPTFASGADYTLMAYGAADAPKLAVLTDDNRLPSVSTRAKIRIVNGLTGTDPLTMQVDFRTETATSDIAAGVASGYATVTSAGSARLEITSPTAVDPLFTLTAASSANLLQAQGVYTVFMLGGQTTATGRLSKDR
jgi:hypothetical protein